MSVTRCRKFYLFLVLPSLSRDFTNERNRKNRTAFVNVEDSRVQARDVMIQGEILVEGGARAEGDGRLWFIPWLEQITTALHLVHALHILRQCRLNLVNYYKNNINQIL